VSLTTDAKTSEEDWDWDSYFLMQHHNGPNRLLDWSDGALMALHFALRNQTDDGQGDARVYVLESCRLMEQLKSAS
jgi:FRG domain-containing protein